MHSKQEKVVTTLAKIRNEEMKKHLAERKIVFKCGSFKEIKIVTAIKNEYKPHRDCVGQAA